MIIPLTQEKVATFDSVDAPLILPYKWCAVRIHKRWYAVATIRGSRVYMHRIILPEAPEVDHIDRDGLNNRRSNLRSVPHSVNIINAEFTHGKYGRGVKFHKGRNKPWQARIKLGGREKSLGYYRTQEEAAKVATDTRIEFGMNS